MRKLLQEPKPVATAVCEIIPPIEIHTKDQEKKKEKNPQVSAEPESSSRQTIVITHNITFPVTVDSSLMPNKC
jgi:hypothetical protein